MAKIKPGSAFRGLHICSFDAGLSDLTRKQQGNPEAVLQVLRQVGRFSVFEASDNPTIAATMTALCRNRLTTDCENSTYPWVNVVAIDGIPIKQESPQ